MNAYKTIAIPAPCPLSPMAIKVFFHICAITRAEEVVRDMIRSLHFSGLYDEAEGVYCYVSGEARIIGTVLELLRTSGDKFRVMKCIPGDTSYERLTLEDIHNHVTANDNVLYIHSKGVSVYHQDDPNRLRCIDDWSYMMLYYLIRHYKLCQNLLERYDTVGINLKQIGRDGTPKPHWCGNFFWVRGDYFLGLPHKIGEAYYDPEQSFLFLNTPRVFEICSVNGINHYEDRCQPCKYIDHKLC